MANGRYIKTSFWKDGYIAELDPIEKLLFLYFITNPQTNLAGMYEINLREVAFDTGIDKDMIQKILQRFCDDGKMYYEQGWLVLTNFLKHQRPNPSIIAGVEKTINELPQWLQDKVNLSTDDNQLSIFVDKPQSGDTLVQSGDKVRQYNLIKSNLNKYKLNKPKANETASAEDFGKMDKRVFAKAVQADEALADKENLARGRPKGSGLQSAREVAEKLKQRRSK